MRGRNYLVTGAQQGIGAAIAVHLGEQGANVGINYLDDLEGAEGVARKVREAGGKALALHGNVTSGTDIRNMIATLCDRFGPLHGLVNNAGIFPRCALVDIAEDEWDSVLGVNLKGTFLATQAAARTMIAQGLGGAIVNISSLASVAAAMGAHYSASKGGILSLTRTAATELGPLGIRVNAISPGLIFTQQPRDYWSDDEIEQIGTRLQLGRVGTVEDIAAAAVFLLGDSTSFMTGQTMVIDGGGI